MRDTCKVTRTVKGSTFNEATGSYDSTTATVYEGKCRLKHPRMAAKDVEAGSQLLVATMLEIQVPVAADSFRAGDVVTITGSPDRPAQAGRLFTVVASFDGTQTTSLRYRIEAADGR